MAGTELTSLDRVLTTLEHKEPDRVPYDLGGSVLTGIHRIAYQNLRKYLGLPEVEVQIEDTFQQLAKVDQDVKDRLGVDVYGLNPSDPTGYKRQVEETDGYLHFADEWGIEWYMPKGHGLYFDMRKHPLENIDNEADLESKYRFPDPVDPGRFWGMAELADKYLNVDKKAYILGRNAAGIFEMALWTRGFQNFYVDMLTNRRFAEALLDKIMEVKLRYWEKALETVGTNVVIVSEADDLCTQNACLVSPALYRQLLKPRHTELFTAIKKMAKRKVYIFYHCCGAVRDLVPDLIESGVDILNPVQVSAAGMDTKELKRLFGRDITFWGGGVDTQRVLPTGTVQQVKDEVRRRIEDLAPGGGFVFTTVHNIQADVPPQNIMAMWEALQEYGKY